MHATGVEAVVVGPVAPEPRVAAVVPIVVARHRHPRHVETSECGIDEVEVRILVALRDIAEHGEECGRRIERGGVARDRREIRAAEVGLRCRQVAIGGDHERERCADRLRQAMQREVDLGVPRRIPMRPGRARAEAVGHADPEDSRARVVWHADHELAVRIRGREHTGAKRDHGVGDAGLAG